MLISLNGFAQRCGGGKLTFNIYTLNGKEIDSFDYKIFPVSKELLKEKFYLKVVSEVNLADKNYELFHSVNESGVIIAEHFVNEIIDTVNKDLKKQLSKWVELSEISQTGKIKSSLFFKTHENANFPIILKIIRNQKTIYILGNYFGGCNREASLIWDNGYGKLK